MSSEPPVTPPETPPVMGDTDAMRERVLAAEFSLGLLEGEELLAARGRYSTDPDFAARREWWDDWFVPLSDDIAGAEPAAHVWDAIAAQVRASAPAVDGTAGSNVVILEMARRVRRWKWTAAITSAAAALALALFITAPGNRPNSPDDSAPTLAPSLASNAQAAPLMASIPIGDSALRLGVTFLPASDEMLLSAAGLSADGVHDHELWLVPADGSALQSLGVVAPGEDRRMALPSDIARNMGNGVRLVLTREPLGGKPDGQDAGPVVAEGALEQV